MNIKTKAVIKYSLASLAILITSFARVLGASPFGNGVFASLCLIGLNPLIIAPIYIAASLIALQSVYALLGSGVVALVFCGLWFLRKAKKFPDYIWYIASPFSLAGYIPIISKEPAAAIIFIFFVPICMYVCSVFLLPLKKRGLRFKLLDNELICGGIVLSIIALGLNTLDVYYFPLVAVVASFLILISGRIYGIEGALIVGICFGIGGAIFDYQIIWLAYYPVMALLAAIFLPTPRIISATANLIGYTLITYFFNISAPYAYLWLIAIFLGGLIYVLIPKACLLQLKNILNPQYSPAASRYNINLLREDVARSVFKTGEVFEEMSFYMTASGALNVPANILVGKVRGEVCKGCGKDCGVSDKDIEALLNISIEKGRATVVDLPKAMMDECRLSPSIISSAGKIAEDLHKKREKQSSEDLAKSIVSEQLSGMGEVLKTMSLKLKAPLSYNFERENKIKEELTYRGIFCYDVVLSPLSATLIVSEEQYDRALTEKILKKAAKGFYKVEREEVGATGLIVYAALLPVYDVVFASAGLAKGEVSGDTHSFIKIGGNKFLMALCDGMGSGEKAEKFSANTISLIECFYKAGFDHGAVIKSVNRFLSLYSEESFSSSDICVLDLDSGITDIFKIGSPACFIKGRETVRAIEGSSLPIGVLDDIRPSFSETSLTDGDMVILMSDGVADCFEGDTLAAEISCASDVSPDELCKQLLESAKKKCKKIRDDMTVVALRLFVNV